MTVEDLTYEVEHLNAPGYEHGGDFFQRWKLSKDGDRELGSLYNTQAPGQTQGTTVNRITSPVGQLKYSPTAADFLSKIQLCSGRNVNAQFEIRKHM